MYLLIIFIKHYQQACVYDSGPGSSDSRALGSSTWQWAVNICCSMWVHSDDNYLFVFFKHRPVHVLGPFFCKRCFVQHDKALRGPSYCSPYLLHIASSLSTDVNTGMYDGSKHSYLPRVVLKFCTNYTLKSNTHYHA